MAGEVLSENTEAKALTPEGPTFMDATEQALADSLYAAIQTATTSTARSQQAREFRIGVSDLGFCQERTRRMLGGETPGETDMILAWIGTVLGDAAEDAFIAANPTWVKQSEVEVIMKVLVNGEPYQVVIPGHPDVINPAEGILLDVKTDDGLADVERNGPTKSHLFQRNLYAVGAYEAGLFSPLIGLDDIRVGNVWIDRAGRDKRLHVNLRPLDLDVVDEARTWLEDVIYAHVNNEPAEKTPPRDMCAVVCGFYEVCRLFDTDVSGLLDDPVLIQNAEMYLEGRDLEREGKRLKDQAKQKLSGFDGIVPVGERKFVLRNTWRNPTEVAGFTKRGYSQIELREVKPPKR